MAVGAFFCTFIKMNSNMKPLYMLGILLSISTGLSAQDVRKLKWGMTKGEVKKIEGIQKYIENKANGNTSGFFYEGSVAGLKCAFSFEFVDGKLYQILYL